MLGSVLGCQSFTSSLKGTCVRACKLASSRYLLECCFDNNDNQVGRRSTSSRAVGLFSLECQSCQKKFGFRVHAPINFNNTVRRWYTSTTSTSTTKRVLMYSTSTVVLVLVSTVQTTNKKGKERDKLQTRVSPIFAFRILVAGT